MCVESATSQEGSLPENQSADHGCTYRLIPPNMTIRGVIDRLISIILLYTIDCSMSFRTVLSHSRLICNLNNGYNIHTQGACRWIASHLQSTMVPTDINFSIGMDPFCYKQFDKQEVNHIPCTKEVFLDELRSRMQKKEVTLRDGYAPFCKHLFVDNFTDAKSGSMAITQRNEHLLRSGYVARTEKELPVLSRWFPKDAISHEIAKAKFLDVILYSREQVIKEHEAMEEQQGGGSYNFDYYIIAIKPQDIDQETPMMPITMFRNTMISEGGSGVPIDRDQYLKSVEFWQNNAIIRDSA